MLKKCLFVLCLLGVALTLTACGGGGSGGSGGGSGPEIESFTATPNPVETDAEVTFRWSVSGDVLACFLSTGDGEVFEFTDEACESSSRAYTYGDAGAYAAVFRIVDASGADSERTVNVTVQEETGETPQPGVGQAFIGLMALPRNSLARFTYSAPDLENEVPATTVPITNLAGDMYILDAGPDGVLYGLTEEGDDFVIYTVDADTGRAARGAVVTLPTPFGLNRSSGDISADGEFWVFSPGRRDIYLRIDLETGEATAYPRPSFASNDTFTSRGQAEVMGFAFTENGAALYIDGLGSDRRPVVAIERPAGGGTLTTVGLLNTDEVDGFEIKDGQGYAVDNFDFYTVDVDLSSNTAGNATLVADLQEQLLSITTLP